MTLLLWFTPGQRVVYAEYVSLVKFDLSTQISKEINHSAQHNDQYSAQC
jgi:hypothetical protein